MNLGDVGPLRAHVSRSFYGPWQLAVWVDLPGRGIWRPAVATDDDPHPAQRWEPVTDPAVQVAPSLLIDDEIGRVLLDALAAHYGGTGEVQTMRADLLHERKRVDKLIDNLLADVERMGRS
jgi:hypothetical protein